MKLKDAYHNSPFKTEKLPVKTVQKQINQRPPQVHKFMKKAGKAFNSFAKKSPDAGMRWKEKVPPYKGAKVPK